MVRKKHLNLLEAMAESFYKTTGIDKDELFSEACLAYCEALDTYDSSKSSYTTWIYRVVESRLNSFIKNELRNSFFSIEEAGWAERAVYQPPFFEVFDSLSADSKLIVQMIFTSPHSYLAMPLQTSRERLVVANLIVKKDWPFSRIWTSLRKLKRELAIF